MTLAGMTPSAHEVHYLEVEGVHALEALRGGFDLVAISSFSAQIKEGSQLAERYRAQRVPVVMGGLHITANPLEPGQHGAIAVAGEGESVWREILED